MDSLTCHINFGATSVSDLVGEKTDTSHEHKNQPGTPVIQCDYCFLKTEEDAPMVTVLVAIDTVYKQMVAISLEKKRNRDPYSSRSLAAFARYVGHPKVIIQGDSEHALMAVIQDACALLTAATPRTLLLNSKGAAERAVQSVEGMARTLRLDLLGRTNIAVGSDLPITFSRGFCRYQCVSLASLSRTGTAGFLQMARGSCSVRHPQRKEAATLGSALACQFLRNRECDIPSLKLICFTWPRLVDRVLVRDIVGVCRSSSILILSVVFVNRVASKQVASCM